VSPFQLRSLNLSQPYRRALSALVYSALTDCPTNRLI